MQAEDERVRLRASAFMQSIARTIAQRLENAKLSMGFSLVIFTPGRVQYVSNCKREDVQQAFAELLHRWTTQEHVDLPYHLVPGLNCHPENVVALPTGVRKWADVEAALKAYDQQTLDKLPPAG